MRLCRRLFVQVGHSHARPLVLEVERVAAGCSAEVPLPARLSRLRKAVWMEVEAQVVFERASNSFGVQWETCGTPQRAHRPKGASQQQYAAKGQSRLASCAFATCF